MAHSQRFPTSFLNTYVALRSTMGLFFADTRVLANTSAVSPVSRNHHSRLSHVQTAIEVSRNTFHSLTDLYFAYDVAARLNHENSVLGIEIDYGVEVFLIDRLVCLFDQ